MARTNKVKVEFTSAELLNEGFRTLKAVKAKKMKPTEANAAAAQMREIARIAKLQLEYAKLSGEKPVQLLT